MVHGPCQITPPGPPVTELFLRPCPKVTRYVEKFLFTVKPRFTNAWDHEQFGLRTNFFSTQSVSDDVLCVELRTCRQKQIALDNFLVRQRPSGTEAESSGAKRLKREKRIPFQTIIFHFLTTFHLRLQLSSSPPSTYAFNSPPHHLPLTPSTLLLTTFHLRCQLSSIQVR